MCNRNIVWSNRMTDAQRIRYTMLIMVRKLNAATMMVVNLCLLTISKQMWSYQLQKVLIIYNDLCRHKVFAGYFSGKRQGLFLSKLLTRICLHPLICHHWCCFIEFNKVFFPIILQAFNELEIIHHTFISTHFSYNRNGIN